MTRDFYVLITTGHYGIADGHPLHSVLSLMLPERFLHSNVSITHLQARF